MLFRSQIIGHTPVTAVRPDGTGFQVDTPRGVLMARDVIVATNGYTDSAVPWLRRRVIPFHGYMIATDVLSEDVITRSEEHTSELQSRTNLVCRLLLEKKKKKKKHKKKKKEKMKTVKKITIWRQDQL